MPGRHFHFTFEFSDEAAIAAVTPDLVTSLLCHAGLSSEHAAAKAAEVLTAARKAGERPCRVQFDAGEDEVRILVTHGGATTWRGTCEVE